MHCDKSRIWISILGMCWKEVKTLEGGRYTNTNLSYIKDGNTLSICTEYSGQITRSFRQLHVNELFDGNQGKRTTDLRQISYCIYGMEKTLEQNRLQENLLMNLITVLEHLQRFL